jgi:hypothetical protein
MISNDQAQQFIRALLRQPTKVVPQTKQEDPLGIFEKAPRATYGRELSPQNNNFEGKIFNRSANNPNISIGDVLGDSPKGGGGGNPTAGTAD